MMNAETSLDMFGRTVRAAILCDVEAVHSPLYDTVQIKQGQKIEHLFSSPLGAKEKTLVETNMYMSGALPEPQAFWLESIGISFVNDAAPWKLIRSGYFSFMIGSRVYLTQPLAHAFTMPEAASFGGFHLKRPLGLLPQRWFGISFAWPHGANATAKLRCTLGGHLFRAVQ